jgi:putrescine importer
VLGWRQGRGKQWFPIALSLAGFVVCFFIWLNLGTLARIAGTAWALVGIAVWLLHGRKASGGAKSS